jgi:hypothetical protein
VKPKASWIIVAIVLVALLSLDVASREQRTPKTWEYKVIAFSSSVSLPWAQAQQLLNQQGAEGWEFVQQSEQNDASNFALLYFKRPT